MCIRDSYQPPQTQRASRSIWTFLKRRLNQTTWLNGFEDGQAVVFSGLVYWIYPEAPDTLSVFLAGKEESPAHIERNIEEVVQVSAQLLKRYPELTEVISGRQMIVSIIDNYQDLESVSSTYILAPKQWCPT